MKKNNKKILWETATVLVVLGLMFVAWDMLHLKHRSNNADGIKITAHRGDSGHAPENTLPAIASAIEKNADFVEVDVRRTADNKLILMHDSSTMRTSGIEKKIAECHLTELGQCDVGGWYGDAYTGTAIPTLQDALILAKGKIGVNIEVKGEDGDLRLARQVVEEIQAYGMESECLVTSRNYEYLQEVEKQCKEIKTGIILSDIDNWEEYSEVDFFSVSFHGLDRGTVNKMKQAGKEIHVWTANEEHEIRLALDMQMENIITDLPAETREFIKNL